jgi:hypothetical protein
MDKIAQVHELRKTYSLEKLIEWRNSAREHVKFGKAERRAVIDETARHEKEIQRLHAKWFKIDKRISKDREWVRTLNDAIIKKALHG